MLRGWSDPVVTQETQHRLEQSLSAPGPSAAPTTFRRQGEESERRTGPDSSLSSDRDDNCRRRRPILVSDWSSVAQSILDSHSEAGDGAGGLFKSCVYQEY